MTGITIYNVQRVVTPKAGNSELWFLCSASYHGDIHLHKVSIKYLKVFKLQSGHIYYRNHYFQYSKGHNSKSRLSRVTVLVFCTLSHDALHLCEVLYSCMRFHKKYLELFSTYRMDMSA